MRGVEAGTGSWVESFTYRHKDFRPQTIFRGRPGNGTSVMKPKLRLARGNRGRVVTGAGKPTQRTGEPEVPARTGILERFRRLKWNELVCHGDFVANEGRRLEPWEGPSGFRADAFVKAIYRRQERLLTEAKKFQ